MTSLAAAVPVRPHSLRFAALVAAPLLLLLFARLLPAEGLGLALRLGAAGLCVLLLPGALIVRGLGRPAEPGLAVAAAFAWSLVSIFFALALTFAAGGSLTLTIAVLVVVSLGALVPAFTAPPTPAVARSHRLAALGVVAAGIAFGLAVWWAAPTIAGDALEHLARARKLEELPSFGRVGVTELFRDAGLHPGYAFPLWHGALALVARLAGVDTAEVVRYLPALLAPLASLVTFGAGAALFRSWAGGIAAFAAQLAYFGLAAEGTGRFVLLTGPATVAVLVLVPALLALAFAYLESGRRTLLASLAAAALALAVVHPTYVLFTALLLGGFLAGRFLLARDERVEVRRIAGALGATLVPAALFFLWLLPSVRATPSFTPDAGELRRQIAHYEAQLDVFGDSFRFAPEAISAGGALAVAALLAVPLAVWAPRSRWAAFVLGGTLPILALLLIPSLFTFLTDFASISQARRLVLFLPWAFAFAGAALLLARFRVAGVAAALAAGTSLQLLYPGDFTYATTEGGGPAWVVWVALAGGAAALLVGSVRGVRGWGGGIPVPGVRGWGGGIPVPGVRGWGGGIPILRGRLPKMPGTAGWTALAAAAFVAPVAIAGLADLERSSPDPFALSPGLIQALRTQVEPGEVVFSTMPTSYRMVAYAPVYVAAAELGHVWDRPRERARDVIRFFSWKKGFSDAQRRQMLADYEAGWVVVDKRLPYPGEFVGELDRVYEDPRYVLYRAPLLRR